MKTLGLISLLLCSVSSVAFGQLEQDKDLYKVGSWRIAIARYGVGCVAYSNYEKDNYISISGETLTSLTLLITTRNKQFDAKLDGSEPKMTHIKIALSDWSWGDVEPYGFRGTPGIVLRQIDKQFLQSFARSKAIKVTDQGHEKLRINLRHPNVVLERLTQCLQRVGNSSLSVATIIASGGSD
jgi:hypothetical protein